MYRVFVTSIKFLKNYPRKYMKKMNSHIDVYYIIKRIFWNPDLYSIQSKHAASPLTSATYVRKHAGPIRLRHACYVTVAGQHAAAASQPTACGRTDRPEVTAPHLWKNVIIFVTTTPTDIKLSTYPVQGRYASACQISPSYDAAFWRR